MTRGKKIGLSIAAVVALGGVLGGSAAFWKKEDSKASVPTLPADGTANRPNGERIDFRRNTVVVVDVDLRTRVARIAAAVKALPAGALAEIVADVGRREDNGELLARERTKLVRNLLVAAGVPDGRLRIVIQDDPTLPMIGLNTVDVRWSHPGP